ncbi:hypothetical protein GCM10009624_32290 [Gordonia sinesedis]
MDSGRGTSATSRNRYPPVVQALARPAGSADAPENVNAQADQEEGNHTVAATQEQLVAGIAEIIEEVTGIEPSEVTMEKSFVDDLDIDSLSMVEIAVQTEDKYGVKIPDEDLAGLRTVGDAVAYIQKLEAENPEAAAAIQAQIEAEQNS